MMERRRRVKTIGFSVGGGIYAADNTTTPYDPIFALHPYDPAAPDGRNSIRSAWWMGVGRQSELADAALGTEGEAMSIRNSLMIGIGWFTGSILSATLLFEGRSAAHVLVPAAASGIAASIVARYFGTKR